MVCTLVSGNFNPCSHASTCTIREGWLCGWGRDKLKVVLRQECISAAETSMYALAIRVQYEGPHLWANRLVRLPRISTFRGIIIYLKNQANPPPTGSTWMCDSWFGGRCRSVNAPHKTSLVQAWPRPEKRHGRRGRRNIAADPQPPLAVVGRILACHAPPLSAGFLLHPYQVDPP